MTKRSIAAAAASLALTSCATRSNPTEATSTPSAAIGQEVLVGGATVAPVAVIEDSRCPANVQCIQAGTVRLLIRLDHRADRRLATIGLAGPIATGGQWLHLTAVCPNRATPAAIPNERYRFRFALFPSEVAPPPAADCG